MSRATSDPTLHRRTVPTRRLPFRSIEQSKNMTISGTRPGQANDPTKIPTCRRIPSDVLSSNCASAQRRWSFLPKTAAVGVSVCVRGRSVRWRLAAVKHGNARSTVQLARKKWSRPKTCVVAELSNKPISTKLSISSFSCRSYGSVVTFATTAIALDYLPLERSTMCLSVRVSLRGSASSSSVSRPSQSSVKAACLSFRAGRA